MKALILVDFLVLDCQVKKVERCGRDEDFAVGKNTSHLHVAHLTKQHSSAVDNKNLYYSPINICLHMYHNYHKTVIHVKSCTK